MHVWNVLHLARWKIRTQKLRKNLPSAHHRTTLSGYIFATKTCIDNREKNLLNSNISSTSPRSVVNFDPLMAEIGWRVWGTPANFSGFRIGTLYIHFWGLLHPNGILPAAKFTLHPSLAFCCIGSIIARHSSTGHQPNVAVWYKEWNYGTFARRHFGHWAPPVFQGLPSRWA